MLGKGLHQFQLRLPNVCVDFVKGESRAVKLIVIICFILIVVSDEIHAQDELPDSIQWKIDQSMSDTGRLNIYSDFIRVTPFVGSSYFRKATKLASKQQNPIWIFNLKKSKAIQLRNENKSEDALNLFQQLIDQFEDEVGKSELATVELTMAEIYHKNGALDLSQEYASRAKIKFKSDNNSHGIGRANYVLSIALRQLGFSQEAMMFVDSAIQQINQHDLNLLASAYNSKGRLYRGLGVYDSAQVYYTKGMTIAQENNDLFFVSKFLNNLGNIAQSKGFLPEALEHYLQSLELKKKLKYKRGLAIAYHNVGAVRVDLKSYVQAFDDFKKSMRLSIETNYTYLQVHNNIKIGNCFRAWENVDSAAHYHQRALMKANEMGFEVGKVDAYINLAEDEKVRLNYDLAVDYLLKAIDLAKKIGNQTYRGFALTSLAEVYLQMDDQVSLDGQRLFTNSADVDIEKLLKQAAQIAQQTENYNGIETSLSALRNYYSRSKMYKQEAEIASRYIQFRDSLFNHQSAQAISEWEAKYESAEREKEIAILRKDNELHELKTVTQKFRFMWMMIISFLLTALGFTVLRYKLKMRRIKQMESLRNQISSDLHDDVGSLLTGLSMQSEILELTASPKNKQSLHRIHEMSRSAMAPNSRRGVGHGCE